ncbi:MAG: adenosylmethionine decarboxylase [Tateyamaria sp.]|uniref:adenosylmethionine decarboxylase n=1 Tax=Tateyamaria sp. TaxID=1929288 RepID=UPI00329BE2D2
MLLDLYAAQFLDDLDVVRRALLTAAHVVNATVLEHKFHVFDEGGGITGIVLLKESHISIHTWPETSFAAVDIFLCGGLSPDPAITVIEAAFQASHSEISKIRRGRNDQ